MPPITLRPVIRTGRLDQNNWQNLELVGKRSNLFHPKMLIESSNVARSNLVHDGADKLVSIRAPRAGRNYRESDDAESSHMFQSAPGVRGETQARKVPIVETIGFQSAPRVRGETYCGDIRYSLAL